MKEKDIITELAVPLEISDVDFRIQSINNGGYATILAYKDARVDQNRLDNVCGANWTNTYEMRDNQLFCRIGIKIGDEWIYREDVGTESFSDKEKGRASDAFKRAGFRWGIGRELYDYPKISIKLMDHEIQKKDGKTYASYNFRLREWKWTKSIDADGKIQLVAFDERGLERFNSTKKLTKTPIAPKPKTKPALVKEVDGKITREWDNVVKAFDRGDIVSLADVEKHYQIAAVKTELQQLIK